MRVVAKRFSNGAVAVRLRAGALAFVLLMSAVLQIALAGPVYADDNFIASITSTPVLPTIDTTPTFEFTTTYDTDPVFTYHCYIDNLAIGECVSPLTISPLEPGEHTFSVNIVDSHGNFSPVVHHTWTINTEAQGDGSQAHPLSIYDCSGWQGMANDLAAYYKLANDIDCTGEILAPIGNDDTPFTGNLDGNGYAISNVEMTNDGYLGTGLFGETNGATIAALRITDSSIVEGEANGQYSIGALTGIAINTNLSDITTSNLTVSTADSSSNYMGGLVGYLAGTSTLEQSYFDGVITNGSSGQNGTGGLVGAALGTSDVANSYALGEVHGENFLGGLIGIMDASSSLRKSYAANTLYSEGEHVGGLVGDAMNAGNFISHSFSAATMVVVLDSPTAGSIAGSNSGTLANNYYVYHDPGQTSILPCTGENNGVIVNCTGEASADYFKGNSSNQPLSSFDEVWNMHEEGQLPTFAIGQVLCDDPPTQSESTLLFGCEWSRQLKHHYSGDAVTRQIRYRVHGSNSAWTYQDWSTTGVKVLIAGLTPATDYDVQFHTQWTIGSSDWQAATAWLSTGSNSQLDTDHDGIVDSEEINGPNLGDANGDHTGDSYYNGDDFNQANVTSFLDTLTGKYAVLQSDCTGNSNVTIGAEATDHKDTGFDYGLGLVNFTATGCGPTATFTQYFYGTYDASKFVARKYNSVTHTYTTIPGAVLSNITISGQTVLKIVYEITDNSPLDQNPVAGSITDPSGPALAVVGVPNTGFGGNKY